MAGTRRDSAIQAWARAGISAGLSTSLQVPLGILLIELAPALWLTYPLLLLPLLLTGPLAVNRGRPRLREAVQAATLAGIVSGTVAAGSLATAWTLLGDWFWMMNAAAGAPPMPPLPRIMILPTQWFSWAHQDILFFQPPLAVALGMLTLALCPILSRLGRPMSRILPRSIGGQLRLAFGALTVLALVLGAVSFATIEEMHIRNHQVQLRADWQRQLAAVRAVLDEELAARADPSVMHEPVSATARSENVAQTYQALTSTARRPGLSAQPADLAAALSTYSPALADAIAAHEAFQVAALQDGSRTELQARPDQAESTVIARLSDEILALGRLQRLVEADIVEVLASNDVGHHQRLIMMMGLVGMVAIISLWTGERVLGAIVSPLTVLAVHLGRVARGDFSHRVRANGPEELRQLSGSVNTMTADLARLYAVERERRAMAEAIATREQELSAAKEFWTNTLVHDLKNPLGLIVGWTEIMEYCQDPPLPSPHHQAIQQIRHAAKALDDLVADINDSFRLQAASLPIRREPIAPGLLLHNAVTDYRGLTRPAPDLRVAEGLGPVLADARLVGRVLHNLIGNAYKHGGAGAVVQLVAEDAASDCGHTTANTNTVRFAVDDDGPGIPAGERERIFERFIQGQGAAHGSGLGLAFCKLVIEQLGGKIWADSSPLGGTRIAFELPRAQEPRLTVQTSSARRVENAEAHVNEARVADRPRSSVA